VSEKVEISVLGVGGRSQIKFLSGILSFLIISLPHSEAAQSVTLAWDANSEPNIADYVLRYGKKEGTPTKSVSVGNTTIATVSDLDDGTTYYFTVIARNTLGMESAPSNEASYTTPPKANPSDNGERPDQKPPGYSLTVINGTGSGEYDEGTKVLVNATGLPGQEFERWSRDIQILSNPLIRSTSALITAVDVTVEAVFSDTYSIRFHPREYRDSRMRWATFEGSRVSQDGPYELIYFLEQGPGPGWSEIRGLNMQGFRYLRYRGPNGSACNVAEIEFRKNGVKLTGKGFGTGGSWNNRGCTFDKALDENVKTFFDAPTGNGAFVGIDIREQ
jgi:hypothetical protein